MAADNTNEEGSDTKAWIEGDMLKVEYYNDIYNFDITKVDKREIERGKFSVVLFDETDSFCVKISSGNSRGVTRNDIYVHKHLDKSGLLSKLESPFIALLRLKNEDSFKERTDIYFMKNMKRFGAVTLDDVIEFEKAKREKEEEEGEDINGCEVTTKTLKLSHALSFYRKLLSQLNVLHKEGVIHFDVTPGNVFLKYSTKIEGATGKKRRIRQLSDIILIDYGLARKKDMQIGLFFNQKRAVGSHSAGNYKTCYKGHSDRKIAWYNEDGSPLELMMTDSSEQPAKPSIDIFQATNLAVWTLTGNSAFYLKGNHLSYMINILKRASEDKEIEELDKKLFDTEKRKAEEKIQQRGLELLKIYRELFVNEYGSNNVEKIENEVRSREYTTLLECVESQYGKMLRQIIEKNNKEILNGSDGQFLDAFIPILVRGTGSLSGNYTSVEDLLAPDNSSGVLNKLEKKYPQYFKYESVEDIVEEETEKESLFGKVGGACYSGLKTIAEQLGIKPKKTSEPSAPQPTPSHAVPPPPPKQKVSTSSSAPQQPAPSPGAQQPLSTSPAVPQSPTTKGEEETLTLDDSVDEAARKDKAVQKLETALEQKGKKAKVPMTINLIAQQLKDKSVSFYQKHKKKIIIGGITAAVLGIGALGYYLYNNYHLCCPRSLDIICGEVTCSEPESAPVSKPDKETNNMNDLIRQPKIPSPSSTPKIAESDMIANPRRAPEGVNDNIDKILSWGWFVTKQPEQPHEPQPSQTNDLGEIKLKTYPRRHVSDPIEIDLVKEGIDGIKTKDDLKKEFNPEKGIEYDSNKLAKPVYNKDNGTLTIIPKKDKDGKPYIGKAQLSIRTEEGDCSTYCFEFSNKKPEALKKGTVVYVSEHGSKEIILEDYFSDDGGNSKLKVNSVEVFDKGKDVVGEIVAGKVKATKEGRKIPISSTGPDFYTLRTSTGLDANGAVKIKITVSDENYSVENWFWVAVTPVNDCPRVKNDAKGNITRYIPKGSNVRMHSEDMFVDPEGDNIIVTSNTAGVKVKNIDDHIFVRNYDKDTGAPLKKTVYVELNATDGSSGMCQTLEGKMTDKST